MVVLLLITVLLRLYINTIEGRRDIDSSFALLASNLESFSLPASCCGARGVARLTAVCTPPRSHRTSTPQPISSSATSESRAGLLGHGRS